MRKIAITGGCGFIGSALVEALQRTGTYSLAVIDDESLGKRADLGGFSGAFHRLDIAVDDLTDALAGVEVVVHLAAHTRVIESIEAPERNFRDNVIGTFRLLEACRKAGVRRFINASTGGAILGEAPSPVHEEMTPKPLSPYGASKLATEAYCSAYTASLGLPCASLRFSNVYGPRSSHKDSVVALFIKRILAGQDLIVYGDGSQVRDYLYVDDLAQAIVQVVESPAVGTFQLGTGVPTALNELIGILAEVVTDRPLPEIRHQPVRVGEVHSTWCDIAKARQAFGYNPPTSLREGVARTWRWFAKQRSSLRLDHPPSMTAK